MNKETISEIAFSIAESNRKSMINVLLKYASDEIESVNDMRQIAEKTDEQLRYALNDLLNYFLNNEHE